MRSKEVDEAIKRIDYLQQDLCSCEECQLNKKAYNTIFAYIEELEELPNKIRDMIKELEEERRKIESSPYDKWDLYKIIGKIEVLKSIIGE